jgi:hypothetical protein
MRLLIVVTSPLPNIEWAGRCRWLDLFAGFVSLMEASRSMVKRAANCMVQWWQLH